MFQFGNASLIISYVQTYLRLTTYSLMYYKMFSLKQYSFHKVQTDFILFYHIIRIVKVNRNPRACAAYRHIVYQPMDSVRTRIIFLVARLIHSRFHAVGFQRIVSSSLSWNNVGYIYIYVYLSLPKTYNLINQVKIENFSTLPSYQDMDALLFFPFFYKVRC